MKVVMVECDNPDCSNIGRSEFEHPEDGSYAPPYGWHQVECQVIGCGPDLTVEVCQLVCVEPALRFAWEEHDRREQEAYS